MAREWSTGRLPVFFEAPADVPPHKPIRVDESTTARQLVVRTMFGDVRRTLPATALTISHQVGEVLVPVVMGLAIDRGVATQDWPATVRWLLVLAAVFAFLSFSFRFGSRIGYLGANVVGHRLRSQVADRILDPRGIAGSPSPGALLSIASSDVTKLSVTVALTLYPVAQLAAVVLCGAILLSISWQLGLLVLFGAPLMLWLLDRAGGPLRSRTEAEQQTVGDAAGSAADLMAGFRVLKGIHAEPQAADRYASASQRALAAVIKARRSEGLYVSANGAVAAVFVVVIGSYAGWMAVRGDLSVGELITVVGLTQLVLEPLGNIGVLIGRFWVSGQASAVRVLTVLQAPYVRAAGDAAPSAAAVPLAISGLPLPNGELNLTFPTAGVTAVVASGQVTDTVTAALSRAVAVPSGAITVGGADLFRLAEAAAIAAVRVAPHAPMLFDGTVGENVAATGAPDDRVAAALLAADCDSVVAVLPQGLDTSVGEAGRLLSGGQRQRVALARALAAESATLILVDPTSAVDSVTELTIAQRLAEIRAGRPTVVFTQSPTMLAYASTIITISDSGTVTTQSTSEVLA